MSEFRLYASDELGKDGYPPEWHATIKHAVREQAGHRCIRCGHPFRVGQSGRRVLNPRRLTHSYMRFTDPPGTRRRFYIQVSRCDDGCRHGGPFYFEADVYDILPRGLEVEAVSRILTVHHLDMNKANCRWWNLASLCQRCHLRIQGRVRMDRVYPWEHSDWFKPYVAGFYAFSYLGEDLSRDETEARLDELLALEHVALPAARNPGGGGG